MEWDLEMKQFRKVSRLREAGAEVVYCLTQRAPKGPNLPRARLNHQDALFLGHGKATHSQTWAGEPAWLGVRGDATHQTPAFTVGYASHARWRDQYRPSRGVNPSEVRPPFRGLTLADRDDEPPAVYTAEEEAALCPVCHVLVVCQEAHAGGKLHTERDQRKKDAAAAAAATEEDIEAALKLLRRERPGLLTPAPDLVPPAAPIPRALELPPLRQSEPVRPAEFIGPSPTDSSATGPGGPITRTLPSPVPYQRLLLNPAGGTCESRCLESGVSTDPEPCGFARPRLALRGFPVSGEKGILVVESNPG
ncbi:uncharacterized protein ISCGN_016636 [Ixodes scapularis]